MLCYVVAAFWLNCSAVGILMHSKAVRNIALRITLSVEPGVTARCASLWAGVL